MDFFWMFLMIMMMLPWVAVAAILLRQPNFQALSNQISVLSTALRELKDEVRERVLYWMKKGKKKRAR
jgi:hypothetical protein